MAQSIASEKSVEAGLGAPVRRVEDGRLVTGRGRYTDDMAMPDMTVAHVVRSPHAHARILRIDTRAARAAPGVLAVLTADDVALDGLGSLACHSFPNLPPDSEFHCPTQPILAQDKVRHVGDRIALVIAETRAQAKDAGELVEIEYEVLPAVTLGTALAPDAPKVWDEAASNLSFQLESGDRGAVDAAFAAAAHVTELMLRYPRAAANTMEPRSAFAYCDSLDGRYTLCTSCQEPHDVKRTLARLLDMSELSLRVIAPDVGGAFGMKGQVYPEEALVLWAARRLGRPVKWTAERSEALATDMQGRGPVAEAALALDADGGILALRTSVAVDVGAYLSGNAGVPVRNATISYPGTYDMPLVYAVARAAFTNTVQMGPYRGTGKPEATFVMERLLDKAAREMSVDPVELRRRNLIRTEDMPYHTSGGYIYDTGDFEPVLDKALALADWRSFETRRAESERRGVRRGIGLAMHCQRAGTFSERMEIRVAPDASVALHVGTLSTGQGHETMFAQMVAGWLSLPMDRVRVFQGDTDKVLFGRGTFAQRSMSAGGSALKLAADEVVEKGKRFSAWMLEASEADMVFEDGLFRVAGTDRQVTFHEVVETSYRGSGVPRELGIGLDGVGNYDGTYSFPNGCMICEVEVDPDTGRIRVDRLAAVDDVGVVVNPLTLEGQLHGSIAQGLGETLVEQVVYDPDSGQLLTGSFMDYGMPRADIMPDVTHDLSLAPCTSNLLGVKGGSEAGNCGAPPAIVNAVIDALAPWGVTDIPLPATPECIWRAIGGNARTDARQR